MHLRQRGTVRRVRDESIGEFDIPVPDERGTSLKHTRRHHLLIAAAAITPTLARVSHAQSWPANPIRVIIPFSAGSTIDNHRRRRLPRAHRERWQPGSAPIDEGHV